MVIKNIRNKKANKQLTSCNVDWTKIVRQKQRIQIKKNPFCGEKQ